MDLFPVFLKLEGRPVLVVGGGAVAAAKVHALAPTGARLTVVAPRIDAAIDARARDGVVLHRRPVRDADLDRAWFVVAAATPAVNRFVAAAAERRRIFVNSVDDPANATAYLGGVLRRDDVTVAISTGGRAPALAGLLREALDATLPADLDRWLDRADALKRAWRSSGVPMADRRPQLADAILELYGRARRPVDWASAS